MERSATVSDDTDAFVLPPRRIPWRRLLAEGLLIVVSILLAFGVDAWWEARTERQREAALLSDLLSEFQASRADLVARLEGARRMARGNAALRDLVGAQSSGRLAIVHDSLILAVIGGPTYEPTTNTLDAAVAGGRIEIIRSDAIQTELANWRRVIVDTREDELLVRQITNEQVVPLLSRQLDLGAFYDRLLPWFSGETAGRVTGATELEGSSELSSALALRGFYAEFSARDLAEMLESLDRLIGLTEAELGAF
jgi:hypothetical protein